MRIMLNLGWLLAGGSAAIHVCFQHSKARAKSREGERRQRFGGKVVVITGAAGDIGSATASAFAREGASLALVDLPHTLPQLEERCRELQSCGAHNTVVIAADMTQEAQVQRMVTNTVELLGPINCFFNNAGIQGKMAPVHQQDSEIVRKVIEVNVVGAFLGLKYVSAAMADSGGGVIVNTASLAGLLGPRYMAAYTASKHAVIGLTKTAAKDLAPYGVRVCAVAPGLLEGCMWQTQVEGRVRCHTVTTTGEEREPTESEREKMERQMIAGTPLGRLGHLSEVAQAVLFLCSEEASYITGTVLTVDGGRLP